MMPIRVRTVLLLVLAAVAAACPCARAADALFATVASPADGASASRVGDPLALVPTPLVARYGTDAVFAQRAVTRDLGGKTPATPDAALNGPQYTYVDVKGWKSPAVASGLSFAVPGAGQLYAG